MSAIQIPDFSREVGDLTFTCDRMTFRKDNQGRITHMFISYWSGIERLHYSLIALAAIGFVSFGDYWNFLGFRF